MPKEDEKLCLCVISGARAGDRFVDSAGLLDVDHLVLLRPDHHVLNFITISQRANSKATESSESAISPAIDRGIRFH